MLSRLPEREYSAIERHCRAPVGPQILHGTRGGVIGVSDKGGGVVCLARILFFIVTKPMSLALDWLLGQEAKSHGRRS